jgi:hydroxypyruvate isomerase
MYLAACIEWLFADDHEEIADRIHAAKAAGLTAVEFHLWRTKPLASIRAALDETGLELASLAVEPRRSPVDPAQHEEFLQAIRDTLAAARDVGCTQIVVASGFERDGVSRQDQHEAMVAVLREAAALAAAAGAVILLEPLNTRVDHPGMYLSSTTEALDIVDEVGSPALKILYDVYHSTVMGEQPREVLAGRIDRVGHVQFADTPGRHEPGSGTIDWPGTVATLRSLGYDGAVGLEYRPAGPTADTLARAHAALQL